MRDDFVSLFFPTLRLVYAVLNYGSFPAPRYWEDAGAYTPPLLLFPSSMLCRCE